MIYYLRMKWWRLRTWLRLFVVADDWRECFRTHPSLHNARHYGNYDVMAGFYNDHVPGGFMTEKQARRICGGK